MATSTIKYTSNADYVVEQGTSGMWTYRKWESGFCEAWGEYSGSFTVQTATGSLYTSADNITTNLPSGLFNSVLMAQGDVKSYSIWIVMANWTTSAISWRPVSPQSRASSTWAMDFYVIGTWK